MIETFGIQNFKAIGQMADIPLKPITLIFGPNSAGKSSIIQSMLMLKQTFLERNGDLLVSNGADVELGGYKEFIHNHDVDAELAFCFDLDNFMRNWCNIEKDDDYYSDRNEFEQLFKSFEEIFKGKKSRLVIKILYNKTTQKPAVSGYDFYVGENNSPAVEYRQSEFKSVFSVYKNQNHPFIEEMRNSYDWHDEGFDISPDGILPRYISAEVIHSFGGEHKARREKYDINQIYYGTYDVSLFESISFCLSQASGAIQQHFKNISHIKSLRKTPKRLYSKTDDVSLMQVFTNENIFEYLSNSDNLKAINTSLKKIGIGYLLQLKFYNEISEDICSINLINTSTGVSSSLKDVGVGISQVLPIVVACTSGKRRNFLIEQPELHLHPAAQTELGDLFIESSLGENKNRFVIETHSEHLILRLLRRIRETADGELPEGHIPIKPEDVAVLYVRPGIDGAEVIELPISNDGEFDRPWPGGFFAERARELY